MKSFKIGDLTINVPIIQGGMGVGVSLSGLASAVANEGGVGVISSAGLGILYRRRTKDFLKNSIIGLREEIRKAKEKTKGIIGVNVMVAMTNFGDMVSTAIEERADIIFSGAGLPLDLPSYLTKESQTKLVPIVSSGRAARIICQKWTGSYDYLPDAIVVEGPKAGGHLGYKVDQLLDPKFSLEELIPEVIEAIKPFEEKYGRKIPIIAAGGISDGNQIHKIINLGASGVQLGSKFVTTTECDASREFKESYLNSKEEDIEIINSPVGMPGRAIHSPFTERVQKGEMKPKGCPFHCIRTCDYKNSPYCIILALYNASKGNLSHGYAFAGANAYLSQKITSVKETIEQLKAEFQLATLDGTKLAVL